MKSKWLCFIFIFVFNLANTQTNLDSLYTVWQDKTQADSSRVTAFQDYIWDGYLFSQPDSALILADRLYEFSSKKNNKKGMGSALNLKGIGYYVKSDFPKALSNYQRSLKIKEEIGDKSGIGQTLSNIGLIYNRWGDYIKALDYHQRSLKISEDLKNKRRIASILISIGNVYGNQDDYPKAIDYYQRSLKINEEIGEKSRIAIALNNIAVAYQGQEEYVNAMEYLQRSLKIKEEIGEKSGIALILLNIGINHMNQNNNNKALSYCNKSLEHAKKISNLFVQKESCECLYEVYKAQGNGNKALAYHEQMLVLNDSLQTEETTKKLQQMEFTKQVLADTLLQVEKDLKVEMAHQTEVRKKDKNKNMALGAGVFFLLLSGGLYSRWRYVKKSKAIIEKEKDRSDNLLLNILPFEIAEELKLKGSADARDFDLVSIIFTDFKGFTQAAEKLTAKALIAEINHCFIAFDHICEKYSIEKIKTIGDAYMAAGGLPVPSDDAVKNVVLAALEMQSFITNRIVEKHAKNETPFEMRLGIHTGPVVAGIVGVKKFQYDIWGDTVNTASRMESSSEVGKVNISQETYKLIKDDSQFSFETRGKIKVKGKGEMEMYFVTMTF